MTGVNQTPASRQTSALRKAPALKGSARRPASALFLATALALVTVAPPTFAQTVPPQAPPINAPGSFSDLSERVIDAVVNISATTTRTEASAQGRNLPGLNPGTPGTPGQPGSPFEDFFEEFFNRRGEGGRGGGEAQPQTPPRPPQPRRGSSAGSGFVVDPSGIVITNNHVIDTANDITVVFNDGQRLKAEVIGRDPKIDIAVLRVKPDKPLKAVAFGDSEKMRRGDWVLAIGNPFGLGSSVSAGIVSATSRNIESGPYDNYIQTDAAINRGNSGGPLFNLQGEVIGINTAILSPSGGSIGIGFAVPASLAQPTVAQLREFGETRRGWLGVRIQGVDESTAEALGLGRPRGALIAGIDDAGPARPAGLEVGDVIVKFDGREIRESRDLPRLVASTTVGKDVEIGVLRKGQEITRTIKLAKLDEQAAGGAAATARQLGQAAPPAVKSALGLDLSPVNDEARKRYSIKDGVKGVVVTRVDPNSNASDKRIQAGDVIVEVGQEAVSRPEDVTARVDALKKEGKKSALLLVSNAQGEVRFVAVTL